MSQGLLWDDGDRTTAYGAPGRSNPDTCLTHYSFTGALALLSGSHTKLCCFCSLAQPALHHKGGRGRERGLTSANMLALLGLWLAEQQDTPMMKSSWASSPSGKRRCCSLVLPRITCSEKSYCLGQPALQKVPQILIKMLSKYDLKQGTMVHTLLHTT